MPEAHVNPLPAIAVIDEYNQVPIVDSANNVVIRDAVGNKSDTTAGNSAISLLKQIEGAGFTTGTDSLKILSTMLNTIQTEATFQHQTDSIFTQANPAPNTWYNAFTATNCRVIFFAFAMSTAIETLEARMTIDGIVYTPLVGQVTVIDTTYFIRFSAGADATNNISIDNDSGIVNYKAFFCEGRNVQIDVRRTTNLGAGTLTARTVYAKR